MIGTQRQYIRAQRAYDNRLPEDDYPDPPEEMDCPKCGATVDLEESSWNKDLFVGDCLECGCECEFDLNDF
jgi:hypothetical protein